MAGRHLQTLNTLTAATLFSFGYDSAGRITSITDGDGNVTTVERNSKAIERRSWRPSDSGRHPVSTATVTWPALPIRPAMRINTATRRTELMQLDPGGVVLGNVATLAFSPEVVQRLYGALMSSGTDLQVVQFSSNRKTETYDSALVIQRSSALVTVMWLNMPSSPPPAVGRRTAAITESAYR